MSLLSASGLGVSLSGTQILSDLDFTISEGTWTGVLGPNGSGKTTLLRAIAGLIEYSGGLRFRDQEVSEWTSRGLARQLAFVRQSRSLAFDFKVRELVLLGRSPHKTMLSSYDRHDDRHVEDALDLVDLTGFEDRSYASLSGGEQQRVYLAQALVQEADVLILDEPTTYLDVHHQYEFMQHVQGLVGSGKTVIGAFHDLEMASRFSDDLLVLKNGRVTASGPPGEVLTSELLASVFRMQARVETDEASSLRIYYANPIS